MNGETVRIDTLVPHPRNPRQGNVQVIAQSLDANGQYQPIVVAREGNLILAGHHTVKAAQSLGWDEIAVVYVDVDEEDAERIMLADNRTSDLSGYDDAGLLDLLDDMGSLEGTAFTEQDRSYLRDLVESALDFDLEPSPEHPDDAAEDAGDGEDDGYETEPMGDDGEQIVGTTLELPGLPMIVLSEAEGSSLASKFREDNAPPEDVLRVLLQLQPKGRYVSSVGRLATTKHEPLVTEVSDVDIDAVFPHPRNARQGDVGAIAASLTEFGQYRPLIVSARTNEILVGSHRWMAAKALGWDTVLVSYVDVDEDAALRILLADNRTSDLGTYDEEQLLALLTEVGSLDGTGYDLDDLDDLWVRQSIDHSSKTARIQLEIPHEKFIVTIKEPWRRYDAWIAAIMKRCNANQEDAKQLITDRVT